MNLMLPRNIVKCYFMSRRHLPLVAASIIRGSGLFSYKVTHIFYYKK